MTVTLVDASNTPDHSTTDARVSEAGSAKIPFRARVSFLRQRIVLTIRFWFRLPIDDIKEQRLNSQIDGLIALNQKALETIDTLIKVSNNMQQRLHFYEENIPRIRELKRKFDQSNGLPPAIHDLQDLARGIIHPSSERFS